VKPNPGHVPHDAIGKRVRVRLENGRIGATDDNPMSPPGWAADGKGGCDWHTRDHPFAIAEYEVIA
jgi:hypothetical protein